MPDSGISLIGDIGATSARFAFVQPGGAIAGTRVHELNDYASLGDAIDAYLAEASPPARPVQAVFAVASPVTGDRITMTNHPWTFSVEALRQHLGLRRLRVVNDFAANAAAVPYLDADDRIQIGGGGPADNAPIGVIGPGTGLGVSALARLGDRRTDYRRRGRSRDDEPGDRSRKARSSPLCADVTTMYRPSGFSPVPAWSICIIRSVSSRKRRRHRIWRIRSPVQTLGRPIRAPGKRPAYFAPCWERWRATSP